MVTLTITSTLTFKHVMVAHARSQNKANLFKQDHLEATLRFAPHGLKECGCQTMYTHPAQEQALLLLAKILRNLMLVELMIAEKQCPTRAIMINGRAAFNSWSGMESL